MTRLRLTQKEKAEMMLAQEGRCAECKEKLQPGNIEFDHTVAGWLVWHKDKPDRAICGTPCHKRKSAADARDRGKVKRLIKKAIRRAKIRKMQGRPFDRKWKRKLDGSVVPRKEAA